MDDLPKRSCEQWSHDFWSELVNRAHLLSRRDNMGELFGWSVRLVWDEGRRGTIYLHDGSGKRRRQDDRLRYVFTDFEPRREARLLLQQIAPERTARA